jgi:hypothetical protein
MTRKTVGPDEIAQAVAMREAGFTVLSISERMGISVRSLQRHFAVHGARKGSVKQELLDTARSELMKRVTSDDSIREEAARLINDDIAHMRHLRGLMLQASAHLQARSLAEAVLIMRAAAAYSTALKNSSDMLRHSLRIDRTLDDVQTEVPELVVRELTEHEVEVLRQGQKSEDRAADMARQRRGHGAFGKVKVLEKSDPGQGDAA